MNGVTEIAEAVARREYSAHSVIRASLAVIDKHNSNLNAFNFLDHAAALRAAEDLDKRIAAGKHVGRLSGVPFGVKDLVDCAGMPTSYGSSCYKNRGPVGEDAVHISRLRTAGAIPVGKTTASEFGMDSATNTTAWGITRNPWNVEKTPGGSSGGSAAAVASGMVAFGTGTDAGGSIRSPAANCGLVGLKPSMGRIPMTDRFSVFNCAGMITAQVTDTARLLDVMSGPHDCDRMSLPEFPLSYEQSCETLDTTHLKVVFSPDLGYMPVDEEVASVVHRAALTLSKAAKLDQLNRTVTFPNIYESFLRISFDEIRATLARDNVLSDQFSELSPALRAGLERFQSGDANQLLRAHNHVLELVNEVANFFSEIDVLLTPVTPVPAFSAEGRDFTEINGVDIAPTGAENFPLWANACWNPSISVPAGRTRDGLPVGLLISAPRHRDDLVLRLARIHEQACPWPLSAPGFP